MVSAIALWGTPCGDALWLMKSKKITIIGASRRPSIEIEGYTLQSPPSGALLKPHIRPDRFFTRYSQSPQGDFVTYSPRFQSTGVSWQL
ncbi:MAG TPA: hypothetical protein VND68_03790 [Chloroflexia bacterium]|nr:hypothetical protein [Chloroflexia bacterium]